MTTRLSRLVVGVASVALVAGGALLGMPASQAAGGTLTLDPSTGTGGQIFAFQTSGGCANANADYYTVVMSGRGLTKDVVLNGVTALTAISATPTQTNSYNNGKIDVPAKPSAIVTVTKDNVKQALIDSGYYQASDFTGLP